MMISTMILHRIDKIFGSQGLDMDTSEVFNGRGAVASGAAFLGPHSLQPAPLALEVPAGDVQDRGAHLGGAGGADDGGGGNLISHLLCLHILCSQHVRLGVNVVQLLPAAALLAIAARPAAAVADTVPDVNVCFALLLHAVLLHLLPRHLCTDPLPPLGADPFKPLPPVFQVARRGRRDGQGLVGGGGEWAGGGGGGGRSGDGGQAADVLEAAQLCLEVVRQLLPAHGDAADRAHRLLPLCSLCQAEVLSLLEPLQGLLVVNRGGGGRGCWEERVREGKLRRLAQVEMTLDERVGNAGVGSREPGLLKERQHGVGWELVRERGQPWNHSLLFSKLPNSTFYLYLASTWSWLRLSDSTSVVTLEWSGGAGKPPPSIGRKTAAKSRPQPSHRANFAVWTPHCGVELHFQ